MLLENVNSPADLRRLSYAELDELAGEIREFIVDAVSAAGSGHLGSNLGAVELTLAVHRVFDSPRDAVLWDTGHQAYVHKIVTGRRDGFAQLRQAGGLSGYPSREESEHDWVENSHASTILSYAYGLASARQAKGDEHPVVAIIGDGSMTGGMAFEGLNNLGHSGRKVIVILNDNGRSYAPTVSKLGESLTRLRLNPSYIKQRERLDRMIHEIPLVGDRIERALEGAAAAIREMFEPPAFFENLGVRYTGPIDGHDIEGVESALRNAKEFDGPIVVHVLTQKGRGHAPALEDDIKCLHDIGGVKPDSYTAAFSEAMLKIGDAHPEVVAITAAMPDSTGLLPFGERFPDRFFDVGIAEQHAITAAAGMAMGGLRPIVAIYSTFTNRAWDQVMYDVGLHRQPVILCVDRAGITGDDGASHHGVMDMALFTKVPGITVFAPSSYQELGVMLDDALEITDGPVVIRWPKTTARQVTFDQVGSGLRARRVREGRDVCILAVGKMVEAAEEAASVLAGQGIEATVWDPRVVTPLDGDMIADARRHPHVVTVEDGVAEGGAGALMASALTREAGDRPAPPVTILGTPLAYLPHGKADAILAGLGLDGAGIAASVVQALEGRSVAID